MAGLTRTAAEVWRRYNTDGVPSTGLHEPDIDEVRQWGTEMEVLVGAAAGRTVTAAGAITVADEDALILVARTVSAAAAINLPPVDDKVGNITIVDAAGVFDSYTQTLTPDGTETIVGLSTYPLTGKFMSITLRPDPDRNQWLVV